MRYRFFDLVVDSDVGFPELTPVRGDGDADFAVRRARVAPASGSWIDVWVPEERTPWVRTQRTHDGYRIRYEGLVDCEYSSVDRRLHVDAFDCPEASLRHFLADQILPLILSLEETVLHASANTVDGAVVGFLGEGGAGKSTMAAVLQQRGHPIVSDDALLLRQCGGALVAVPGPPGVRLWPEMAAVFGSDGSGRGPRKVRVLDGLRFQAGAAPVDRLYVLDRDGSSAVAFSPLTSRDAAVALLTHSYRLEQADPRSLVRQIDDMCRHAAGIPVWRLAYPGASAQWDAVADAIVAHARDTVPMPCCSSRGTGR